MNKKVLSGVHLVGSIPLSDTNEVLTNVSKILGQHIKRIPDGETGERSNWAAWQLPLLQSHPDMEARSDSEDDIAAVDARNFKHLCIKDGVDPLQLQFKPRYAEFAIASYQDFAALKQNGDVPAHVRFQISLPTPFAIAGLYISPEHWQNFIPAYERAMLAEIRTIENTIPNSELAVQWDVCLEVIYWEGLMTDPFPDMKNYLFSMMGRLIDAVDLEIECGIHLCYGDPGHKHIVEPEDMKILTEMTNGISHSATRLLNWVHMPVPIERFDDEYFTALQGLELNPETEIYLGLVHFTDQDEGALKRIASAEKFIANFGIATECGFGRRPIETVIPLLELHARVCEK